MDNVKTDKNITNNKHDYFTLKNVVIFILIAFAIIFLGKYIINSTISKSTEKEQIDLEQKKHWQIKKVYNEINDTYFTFATCTSNAVTINGKSVSLRLFIRRDNEGSYISYISFNEKKSPLTFNEVMLKSESEKVVLDYSFDSQENVYKFKDVSKLLEIVASHKAFSIIISDGNNYSFDFESLKEDFIN